MLYTLTADNVYQEDIKRSRFIAYAGPVKNPVDALRFIAEHSIEGASHNCWAYRVAQEYRFNDDGEPGGTAGRPILQAIEGQDCDRVVVLVVRWFGGIKLGSGGLIRAYGGVAAQCLRLADRVALVDEASVQCQCSYSDMALVQSRFNAFEARVEKEEFDARGVRWSLILPRARAAPFADQFTNMTRGQGSVFILEQQA